MRYAMSMRVSRASGSSSLPRRSPLLGGLGEVGRHRRSLPRNVAEILFDLGQRLLGIEIAHQGEHRVVGRVVGLEELLHVVHRRGVQILHGTDHGVVVGEIIVDQLFELLGDVAVGHVIAIEPAFLFYGLALVLQVLLRDHQAAHAVGFQEETEIDLILREHLVVGSAVGVGGAVGIAAVGVDQEIQLAHADVFRALEHHVFEEVGEAGASAPFVLGAHLVRHGDGVDRGVVVFGDDDAQSVVEPGVGELDLG